VCGLLGARFLACWPVFSRISQLLRGWRVLSPGGGVCYGLRVGRKKTLPGDEPQQGQFANARYLFKEGQAHGV